MKMQIINFFCFLVLVTSSSGLTSPLPWTQLGDDIDGEAAEDGFGWSIDMSSLGHRIIVGAKGNDGTISGSNSGHARVFEADSSVIGGWRQIGTDIDGRAAGDLAGSSVAMSDDGRRIIIGAPGNSEIGGVEIGYAMVFEEDYSAPGGWRQIGSVIEGEATGDLAGTSVDISSDGKRIAVGSSMNDNPNGVDSGHVRIFDEDNTTDTGWRQFGSSIEGEAQKDVSAARVVRMSSLGNRIIIGSDSNDGPNGKNSGHARVFEEDGSVTGGWKQVGSDIDGKFKKDKFGFHVAMSDDGNRIIVGGIRNDGNGLESGHVMVFEEDATSDDGWSQIGNEFQGDKAGDFLGAGLDMNSDGKRIIIGGWNATYVRVFEEDTSAVDGWSQLGDDFIEEGPLDKFGQRTRMSSDGKIIAIGAWKNDEKGKNTGHVRVFEEITPTSSPTFTPAASRSFEIESIGQITGRIISNSTIELFAAYNASNREYQTTVYSPTCFDLFTGSAADAFNISVVSEESLGNGFIAFNSSIKAEISKLRGTMWWEDLDEGYGGIIDMCIKAAVYVDLSGQYEQVNHLYTNLTLAIEMNADFSIASIDATNKGIVKQDLSLDYKDSVETYQCDPNAPDTPLSTPLPTYEQGDLLNICVRGKASVDGIVEVTGFRELVVSQEGDPSSSSTYLTNSSVVSSDILEVNCGEGTSNVCVAKIVLLGKFFSADDPGDLAVSGEVDLSIDTGGAITRHLGGVQALQTKEESISHRRSETTIEEEAGFSLIISLSGRGYSSLSLIGLSTMMTYSLVACVGAGYVLFL